VSLDAGDPSLDGAWGPGSPDGDEPLPPVALDGIGYGVGGLDAILALHLGDAHLHAAFVRDGAGLTPGDVAIGLRDAYRGSQLAAQRLVGFGPEREAAITGRPGGGRGAPATPAMSATSATSSCVRDELPGPVVTLEIEGRTVLLRRVRAYVVACLFDGTMPLGMARLVAQRVAAALSPELPLEEAGSELLSEPPSRFDGGQGPPFDEATDRERDSESARKTARPAAQRAPSNVPARRAGLTPPPASAPLMELERTLRLLALLDARAPEPHVARLRLALRAGLAPLALEHPDALGAEGMLLIESAVEDILGLDRAALRRLI
jgi:hypothetical protein